MILEREGAIRQRVGKYTLIALLVSLVAYPVLYSTDFFGNILFSVLPEEIYSSLLNESSRAEWWDFYVLSTKDLNQAVGDQKTISLGKLIELKPITVPFGNLFESIDQVVKV